MFGDAKLRSREQSVLEQLGEDLLAVLGTEGGLTQPLMQKWSIRFKVGPFSRSLPSG